MSAAIRSGSAPWAGFTACQRRPPRRRGYSEISLLLGEPLTASPARARILELGCLRGENLLAITRSWPEAHLVGVDFAAPEIARARTAAAGRPNVTFHHADLRDFDPGPEPFDYLLCHGVFSWVPDGVKTAILRLCGKTLAPDGIAFISYNTYPGWLFRDALRETLLLGGELPPAERVAHAGATLDFLAAALEQRTDAFGGFLRDEIESRRRKLAGIFSHDELGPVNDPCYFMQFVEWAAEHGLAYVAESPPVFLSPHLLPPRTREALEKLRPDRLRYEQLCDLLCNRPFRGSVLCRAAAGRQPAPRAEAIRELKLVSRRIPAPAGLDLSPSIEMTFCNPAGQAVLRTTSPVIKAAFHLLAASPPGSLTGAELLARVGALGPVTAGEPGGPEALPLLGCLLDAIQRGDVTPIHADISRPP